MITQAECQPYVEDCATTTTVPTDVTTTTVTVPHKGLPDTGSTGIGPFTGGELAVLGLLLVLIGATIVANVRRAIDGKT